MKFGFASRRVLALLPLCLFVVTCSNEPPARNLGACWNINTEKFGPVSGEGIFISSMHGFGFEAPDCDDRDGHNNYELSKGAEASLQAFREGRPAWPRYLRFAFAGRIYQTGTGNVLVITRIDQLRESDRPKWIDDLYRQHGLGEYRKDTQKSD